MSPDVLAEIATKIARERIRVIGIRRNHLSLWIGRLVISFNDLEKRLADALASELVRDDRHLSDMLGASMSFGQKLDLFTALLLRRFADSRLQSDRVKSIGVALSCAEDFRNAIVHSAWIESTFGESQFSRRKPKTKGRKGLRVDEGPADIARLRTAVQDTWFLSVMGIACALNDRTAQHYGVGDEIWSVVRERFSVR